MKKIELGMLVFHIGMVIKDINSFSIGIELDFSNNKKIINFLKK